MNKIINALFVSILFSAACGGQVDLASSQPEKAPVCTADKRPHGEQTLEERTPPDPMVRYGEEQKQLEEIDETPTHIEPPPVEELLAGEAEPI